MSIFHQRPLNFFSVIEFWGQLLIKAQAVQILLHEFGMGQ